MVDFTLEPPVNSRRNTAAYEETRPNLEISDFRIARVWYWGKRGLTRYRLFSLASGKMQIPLVSWCKTTGFVKPHFFFLRNLHLEENLKDTNAGKT